MLAAQSGALPIVERLLQEPGLDLDIVNKAGRRAEQCGRRNVRSEVEVMVTHERLRRKTHASPNGIASGFKRKREEEEEGGGGKRAQYWEPEEQVVNTRDFHRERNTPQRRNTIALGDLDKELKQKLEQRGAGLTPVRGSKPNPPTRTTSLKTVVAVEHGEPPLVQVGAPYTGHVNMDPPKPKSLDDHQRNAPQLPDITHPDLPTTTPPPPPTTTNLPRTMTRPESGYSSGTTSPDLQGASKPSGAGDVADGGQACNSGLSAGLDPGLKAALASRLEQCLIDLGTEGDNVKLAKEVLAAAKALGLEEVATVCRCILRRNITAHTVLPLLEEPGGSDPVVAADCIAFISANLHQVCYIRHLTPGVTSPADT